MLLSEKTLPEIVEELGITSTIQQQDTPLTAPEWAREMNAYRITLRFEGRKMSFSFYQGRGNKAEPTTADAVWTLACDNNTLLSSPTIEDFGGEFGWDATTRATYRAIKKLSARYVKLIGNPETIEMLGQVEY
jgi:hypothetical protein